MSDEMSGARCAGAADPELWFGGNWRQAKAECIQCPVRLACAKRALDYETADHKRRLAEDGRTGAPQCDGVWGGLTAPERARIIGQRIRRERAAA